MKFVLFIITFFFLGNLLAQQSLIPLHSFYKDQLFANKSNAPINEGSFLPVCESDYDLMHIIRDSSKQYYKFTHVLFQKYLFELKGKDYYLKISPAIDFGYGRDLGDTTSPARTLFQNTRGLHVEGNLFKNFAFSTSLYENQGRYTNYETSYYGSLGELYPSDSSYLTQNGVIPGGGRTKPFKGDAFDYAYAIGYLVYRPFKWLRISAGNNAQFIGDGHRSLLLSDNSYSAPYLRFDWRIGEKFNFVYYRARYMNLMRRPASGSVESYYEAKGYSVNYLTFKPNNKISLSLFEGSMWNRGDSVTSRSSHPLYYNPIPIVSGLILNGKNEMVTLIGLNMNYQFLDKHRLYGQLAMNDFSTDKLAFQLGYRGYNFFGINDFMLQLEYNNVANGTYETSNRRLNYAHYNLPLAHVKGNGFQEFILRSNYEVKRVYVDLSIIYYLTRNYSSESLLPVYRDLETSSENIFFQNTELGYRFNRKMNLTIYGNWTYRLSNDGSLATNFLSVGLRTGFLNHYKDF